LPATFAGFSQVGKRRIECENAHTGAGFKFIPFIGIQQRTEDILRLIRNICGQQVLQSIQQLNGARRTLQIGQPVTFYETKSIAGTPGVAEAETKGVIDLFKDQRIARYVFVQILFDGIKTALPAGERLPKPTLLLPVTSINVRGPVFSLFSVSLSTV
jgi:hypothetical protein